LVGSTKAAAKIEDGAQPLARILIVDDDRNVSCALRDLLRFHGFAVETAPDPERAAKTARTFQPDIALLDIRLGRFSGVDLVPVLRRQKSEIVCIMITAYADTDAVVRAMRNRADDYLRKPLQPDNLLQTLNRHLERQRLDRERAETIAAMRENEKRLNLMIECAADGILTIDEGGVIESANPAAAAIFGYEPNELIGRECTILMAEIDARQHDSFVRRYLQTDDSKIMNVGPREIVGRRKDGSIVQIELAVSEMRFNWQRHFIHTIRDITERKKAQQEVVRTKEQAEQASLAKSQFLAMMSHELRTPLNAILGFAEILRDEQLGPMGQEKHRDYAGDIWDSGSHLLKLINNILDLSKIEAGGWTIDNQRVSIAQVVADCCRMVTDGARAAKVALEIDLDPQISDLVADERALKQILLNLVANAIKFTPEGGRIAVAAILDAEGRLGLAITDDGIGIKPEEISAIMEPFVQLEGLWTRSYEGSGLGMPIAKALAELHGGELHIESQHGVGTKVTAWFPKDRLVPSTS
jgi:PAS domain S-box-containing protein